MGRGRKRAPVGGDPLKHLSPLLFPMQPKFCCFVLSQWITSETLGLNVYIRVNVSEFKPRYMCLCGCL